MKIQLFGAARTVTGSFYAVEANNVRFAIDCGLHQGNSEIEKRNRAFGPAEPKDFDFVLLTHAHMDHSGRLPKFVKDGFKGPVYCTEPTKDLLDIMLLDSAHIQEMEAEWQTRKQTRRGAAPIQPLYETEDAIAATKLLRGVTYNTTIEPAPGVRVTYRDAGHILGSAFLELEVQEAEGATRIIFSGDLGRPHALLVNDPQNPLLTADYLFMESTYGDRNHKHEDSSRDELAEAIMYSYNRGEKTIIPAFAVERTQEVIYSLHLLIRDKKIPANIPVFVDSPLAIKATEIFRRHPKYFDRSTLAMLEAGEDPLSLPNLKYTADVKESQAINETKGPGIIISASGMCNAGRVKHHLRHNLWRPGASVVFAGYQAVGTPGRKIVDGAKSISLLGEEIAVAAKIFTIGGFSGHAGQSQILDWLSTFARPDLKIFLVHGEEKAQTVLAGLIKERFGILASAPDYQEELILAAGKAPLVQVSEEAAATRKINWALLLDETDSKMAQLRAAVAKAPENGMAAQVELQDHILELNSRLLRILSQI